MTYIIRVTDQHGETSYAMRGDDVDRYNDEASAIAQALFIQRSAGESLEKVEVAQYE